ncbi:MAG TPA: hypothetical protein VFS43_13800 [Polyangiaceae bacterium]|nr:hypothetical protein [Polyangiaceae bacterium]
MRAASALCFALAAAAGGAGCLLTTPVGELDDEYGSGRGGGGSRPRVEGSVAGCDPIAANSGSWVLAPDSARVSNYLRLTPAQNGALGAFWWSTPMRLDELEISFEFRINPAWDGTSGVGFAFAWTSLREPPAQNASFPGFGLPQARGWALAFRSTPPIEPPNKPSFLLIDGSRSVLVNNAGPAGQTLVTVTADAIVDDPSFWHEVAFSMRPNSAEIFFRGSLLASPGLEPYEGFEGVWGFTASTNPVGPLSEFSIRNVRVFAPYDGGCVR